MTGIALERRSAGAGPAVDLGCTTAAGADGGCLIVGLSGELDVCCADAVVDLVGWLCTDGQRALVVDLAGVEFVDVAGLRALLLARRVVAGYQPG